MGGHGPKAGPTAGAAAARGKEVRSECSFVLRLLFKLSKTSANSFIMQVHYKLVHLDAEPRFVS